MAKILVPILGFIILFCAIQIQLLYTEVDILKTKYDKVSTQLAESNQELEKHRLAFKSCNLLLASKQSICKK